MMNHRLVAPILCLVLAACGSAEVDSGVAESETLQQSAEPPAAEPTDQVQPQIAYTYGFAFRVPRDELSRVQDRHMRLCEQLGTARCRIEKMERSASHDDYASGTLTLSVAAPIAREFSDRLVSTVSASGGETVDRQIDAEDLTKQIVDTDARVHTKEALVRRLTALLETRSGNIAQAVEAERAVNQAQEELEQARAWLGQMRHRVAMSAIDIRYESSGALGVGFVEPLSDSFRAMGTLFGKSLAALVQLIAILLPWLIVGGLIGFGAVRVRRYLARRTTAAQGMPQAD